MAPTSLLRTPVPPRGAAPRPAARTAHRHGRLVRRRRGPGLLGLALSAVLAGWLAAHAELVDVPRLLGGPTEHVSVVVLDGAGAELPSTGANETH